MYWKYFFDISYFMLDFNICIDYNSRKVRKGQGIRRLHSRTTSFNNNGFRAAREYRVVRNGHVKLIDIYVCFLGGCCITERNF